MSLSEMQARYMLKASEVGADVQVCILHSCSMEVRVLFGSLSAGQSNAMGKKCQLGRFEINPSSEHV